MNHLAFFEIMMGYVLSVAPEASTPEKQNLYDIDFLSPIIDGDWMKKHGIHHIFGEHVEWYCEG